ncbi:Non-specific serine/threonine protein kinase [Altererythrobacter insulae]|nr:Non-specific serine/threonine protein kinase [Altererythrobacter insulae]
MDGLIDDLTDKEKEALRLLLAGHDTKSSASELDISVHTVNDRLRNARRKLHVSSSREAARILGEAEGAATGGTPQIPAHTSFGIPLSGTDEDTADLTNTQPSGPFGLTWLAGGMLIMSIVIAAAIIGVVYFADGGATTAAHPPSETESSQATPVAEPDSLARAENFLKFVDSDDWAGSWEAAGASFRDQATLEEWTGAIEPVREQVGKLQSRKLLSVQRTSTLPSAPEGEYEILQYESEFSGVDIGAVETLIMVQVGEGWDVAGYFVRPGKL